MQEFPDEAEVYLDGSGRVDHVLVHYPEARVWHLLVEVRTYQPGEKFSPYQEYEVWEEVT